jgi:hypothetical protein
MFWVGQQVVCVDDSDHFPLVHVAHDVIEVKKGQIYTIRFRPLVKTDISIFQAMLTPIKEMVDG